MKLPPKAWDYVAIGVVVTAVIIYQWRWIVAHLFG